MTLRRDQDCLAVAELLKSADLDDTFPWGHDEEGALVTLIARAARAVDLARPNNKEYVRDVVAIVYSRVAHLLESAGAGPEQRERNATRTIVRRAINATVTYFTNEIAEQAVRSRSR